MAQKIRLKKSYWKRDRDKIFPFINQDVSCIVSFSVLLIFFLFAQFISPIRRFGFQQLPAIIFVIIDCTESLTRKWVLFKLQPIYCSMSLCLIWLLSRFILMDDTPFRLYLYVYPHLNSKTLVLLLRLNSLYVYFIIAHPTLEKMQLFAFSLQGNGLFMGVGTFGAPDARSPT